MAGPRVKAMRRVPLAEAPFRQMVEFAKLGLGLELGPSPSREAVAAKLGELGHEFVWLADVEGMEGAPLAPQMEALPDDEPRTDPETERWVFFQIEPEIDFETGQRRDSTVPMSVNQRSVAFPRGVPVWGSEIFYVHLTQNCVEKRYAQHAANDDGGPPGKRYSYEQPRFNVRFIKYGGVLMENPVPQGWREGERVYGPDGHVPNEVLVSHRQQADHRIQSAA